MTGSRPFPCVHAPCCSMQRQTLSCFTATVEHFASISSPMPSSPTCNSPRTAAFYYAVWLDGRFEVHVFSSSNEGKILLRNANMYGVLIINSTVHDCTQFKIIHPHCISSALLNLSASELLHLVNNSSFKFQASISAVPGLLQLMTICLLT